MPKTTYIPRTHPKFAELPNPAEWVKRTALTFSKRADKTLVMDKAYENFYSAIGSAKEAVAAKALYEAMRDYLSGKTGQRWANCERNKASKGMLERIYNELWSYQLLTINAKDARANQLIDDVEVPHARFGTLYLLANISIELTAANYVAMGLGGASVLGTIGATAGTFQVFHNNPADLKNGSAVFSGSGLAMKSRQVDLGNLLGRQNISTLTSASAGGVKAIGGIVQGDGTDTLGPRSGVRPKSAREILALTKKQQTEDKFNHLKRDWAGYSRVTQAGYSVANEARDLKNMIVAKVEDIVAKLRAKLLANGDWPFELAGSLLKTIMTSAVAKIFAAAAPYIGAATDVVTGVARTIAAVAQKVEAYYLRKSFTLKEGHPQELARAIEGQMEWAIGKGLTDSFKGVAGIASQVFLPGAGSLVSAIIAGLQWLVQTVMRVRESFKIKEFLEEASAVFRKEPRQSGMQQFAPAASGGLVHDTRRFTEFFRKGCNASPIIPMLVLNSGICGSLMVMINMLNDLREPSQDAHDAGAKYLGNLKTFGAKYMRDSGFSFAPRGRGFVRAGSRDADRQDSALASIQGLLNHALNSHNVASNKKTKALAMLLA